MIEAVIADGVKTITLNRPGQRNALTPEAMPTLREHVQADGEHRVILLVGEGPAFCAGFDLDCCRDRETGQEAMRSLLSGLSAVVWAMRKQSRPVVLAAHGAAIAGGCALLGGADVVVADRQAKLGYPVTRLGISPAVSAPFMREGVGDGYTRRRMLDSELFTAEEGYRRGLVHELTATPEEAISAARRIAAELARKSVKSLKATKGWLWLMDNGEAMSGRVSRAARVSESLAGEPEAIDRLERYWAAKDERNRERNRT